MKVIINNKSKIIDGYKKILLSNRLALFCFDENKSINIENLAKENYFLIKSFCDKQLSRLSESTNCSIDNIRAYLSGYSTSEFVNSNGLVLLSKLASCSKIPLIDLIVALGYSDFKDLISKSYNLNYNISENCTSFKCSENNVLFVGQNWDMSSSLRNYTCLICSYNNSGFDYVALSTYGFMPYIGMNSTGLFIGTNNLSSKDSKAGLIFNQIIHDVLIKFGNAQDAINYISKSSRLSGHNYIVADFNGNSYNIETTSEEFSITNLKSKTYTHSNHYFSEKLNKLANSYSNSSLNRSQSLKKLLDQGKIDIKTLYSFLSNHKSGICRHESIDSEIITLHSIISVCSKKQLLISESFPCENNWFRINLKENKLYISF